MLALLDGQSVSEGAWGLVLEGRDGLGLLLWSDGSLVIQRDGSSRVEAWTPEGGWARAHSLMTPANENATGNVFGVDG